MWSGRTTYVLAFGYIQLDAAISGIVISSCLFYWLIPYWIVIQQKSPGTFLILPPALLCLRLWTSLFAWVFLIIIRQITATFSVHVTLQRVILGYFPKHWQPLLSISAPFVAYHVVPPSMITIGTGTDIRRGQRAIPLENVRKNVSPKQIRS